jgi:accessory gene regulator B
VEKLLERLAQKLTDAFVSRGADPENKEIYAYAIEYILSNIVSYGLLLILATILHVLPTMLLFLLFWIPLRTNMGGLHAPSQALCLALSALFGVGAVFLAIYCIPGIVVLSICLAASIIVTFKIAPVIHPNHPVSEKRRLKGKKIARVIIIAESAVIIFCFILFPYWVASVGLYSVVFAVVFGILGDITNKIGKTRETER